MLSSKNQIFQVNPIDIHGGESRDQLCLLYSHYRGSHFEILPARPRFSRFYDT